MAWTGVELVSDNVDYADGVWTGSRIYDVQSDSADDTAQDAVTADDGTNSIPTLSSAWESGSTLKVIGYSVKRGGDDDTYLYLVTVKYSSKVEDFGSVIENPLARPTVYSYEDSQIQEPYFRDTDDDPNVNSAGDDFTDLPTRDRSEGIIVITRNVASFSDTTAESMRNKVNSGAKTINGIEYAAETLRIVGWSGAGPIVENEVTYYTETIRIAKKPEGWDDVFEDRGLHQLVGGERVPILDGKNLPVTVPYPLNGSGVAQANPTDAPALITRKPYETDSFASV